MKNSVVKIFVEINQNVINAYLRSHAYGIYGGKPEA
jgi:hypothetical protein